MNIGIYIYDQAEVLDFSGPFEVFSTAKRLSGLDWNVLLIAESEKPVTARGGYLVIPHCAIHEHPSLDALIVVGGVHTDVVKKTPVIEWIASVEKQTPHVASVCTGAFLLAQAGLLDGRTVTTHWEDIPDLANNYPKINVVSNQRWVSDGKYTTSAGISAGIDMSLYLVGKFADFELAEKTARQMEYDWCKQQ